MAEARWGTKRRCPGCGISYYDLNRTPPTCPKCGTVYHPPAPARSIRPSGGQRPAAVEPAEEEPVSEVASDEETGTEDDLVDAEELNGEDEDVLPPGEEEDER